MQQCTAVEFILTFIIFICATKSQASFHHDYYWRDYTGKIPDDAIPAGNDTYIGQTYVHGHGLFVFQIFPRTSQFEVAAYGYKKSDKLLKILCSREKEKFTWITTSSRTFQLDMVGKNLVIGGYDHVDSNKGMLYIGRFLYQFLYRIGSITGYLNNAYLKYIIDRREQKDDFFEVLVYDENNKIERQLNKNNLCPHCEINDFYWKEYVGDGEIPADAIIGGFDANSHETFIGQAYIHNLGVFVTTIHPKQTQFEVAAHGNQIVDYNIKILCTNNPDAFQWQPSGSKTYKTDVGKFGQVITGGYDKLGNGDLIVGRVFYQGVTYVGSITPFKAANLWFVHRGVERSSELYQVLTYNHSLVIEEGNSD